MQKVLLFLDDLSRNNNREWFNRNRERYEQALAGFRDLAAEIHSGILIFDPSLAGIDPADSVFRIYKDIRFSKDKTPYKTHFGCWLTKRGRKFTDAGYYFHLEPGKSFMAAGSHAPPPEQLKLIRQEIAFHPEEYFKITGAIEKENIFERHEEDKLKKGPVDFPKDFEYLEEIKYRHYIYSRQYSDQEVVKAGFVNKLTGHFRILFPFVDYLNHAMSFSGND
jgi:uncharacterized protein (TIGR02453 family)